MVAHTVPLPEPRPGDTILDVHYVHLKMWRDDLAGRYMADHESLALDVALQLLDAARAAAKTDA